MIIKSYVQQKNISIMHCDDKDLMFLIRNNNIFLIKDIFNLKITNLNQYLENDNNVQIIKQ